MGLINRDMNASQQKDVYTAQFQSVVGNGLTFPLCNIPYNANLFCAEAAAYGLSGSPVYSLWIYRFIAGTSNAGFTSIPVGQTLTMTAYGTSGALGFSIFAGLTYPLVAGDQIVLYSQGGSSTASLNLTVSIVVQKLQDFVNYFGV